MGNVKPQTALSLTTIQLSGAISLPVLMAGYFIGISYSITNGLTQIALANLLLCVAACTYVQVAILHKEITVQIAKRFFGKHGGLICSAGMLLMMFGWSVIQLHYTTIALQILFNLKGLCSQLLFSVLICLFFYLILVNSLNKFDKLNRFLFPIMIAMLAYSFMNYKNHSFGASYHSMPTMMGIIMILTASSGLLYDLPTYYHNAATYRDAKYSLISLFIVIIPSVQILGLILAKLQLVSVLSGFEMTKIFASFNQAGLGFLIISSFLSNCLNIYSSVVIVKQFVNLSYKNILKIICIACAISGYFVLDDALIPLLEVINILGEIMICLILVYIIFNGKNFNKIELQQANKHAILLYSVLISAILIKYLPFISMSDYFINAAFLSLSLMSIYCFGRKYL